MRSRITLLFVLITLMCAVAFGSAAANDDRVALRGVAARYNEVDNTPNDDVHRSLFISPETRGKLKGAFGKIRDQVRGVVDKARTAAGHVKDAIKKHAPNVKNHVQGFIQRAKGFGHRVADKVRNAVDKAKTHFSNAKGHVRGIIDRVRNRWGHKGGNNPHGAPDVVPAVEPLGEN